ncbi:Ribosomal protein lysine methyltransferase [Saitoella coloradoensis]
MSFHENLFPSSLDLIPLPGADSIEEDTSTLFASSSFTSENSGLGMLSSNTNLLRLTVHLPPPYGDRDLGIAQSPSGLREKGSTTGNAVWRVTPPLVEWVMENKWFSSLLNGDSTTVLELGAGVAGILPAVLAPRVKTYVATDHSQQILKILRRNIEENLVPTNSIANGKKKKASTAKAEVMSRVIIDDLDWLHPPTAYLPSLSSMTAGTGFSIIFACDTIYNEALIAPHVSTLHHICSIRPADLPPTLVMVATELRSYEVHTEFLQEWTESGFEVYRVGEEALSDKLKEGFAVYIGALKR